MRNRLVYPLNDIDFEAELKKAMLLVIIEPIQGVDQGTTNFSSIRKVQAHEVVLILDEVQSGFGRSGKFFAQPIS
jgi:acetylornithine aminotransferase